MADAIVPHERAPKPVANTAQDAQTAQSRDYSAEYERREAIALAEGFPSYWAKRKARQLDPSQRGRRRRPAA